MDIFNKIFVFALYMLYVVHRKSCAAAVVFWLEGPTSAAGLSARELFS